MSTHLNGLSNTKLYRKHRSMLDRCNSPKHKSYKDYGGRGIKVCDEWQGKDGFLNFYNWSMQNGYEDGLTIERKDTNGDYCPSNCCSAFVTKQQFEILSLLFLLQQPTIYYDTFHFLYQFFASVMGFGTPSPISFFLYSPVPRLWPLSSWNLKFCNSQEPFHN